MKRIFLIILFIVSASVNAQDGTIDNSFTIGTGTTGFGNAYLIKELPGGKILLGGQFTGYNGNTANKIARLNADGTFDPTFNAGGTGFDEDVMDAYIESDGKIVVVGEFSSYNGILCPGVVRLNADGTRDNTFSINSFNGIGIYMISKQNSKYIVSGEFGSINGVTVGCIARLNNDGSTDTAFLSSVGAAWSPGSTGIAENIVQNDGKIIIVGTFGAYAGVARKNIARLNADGTLDTTFNPGTGPSSSLYGLAVQTDGKYIIGGNFSQYNGTSRRFIARINTNGSIDTSFDAGTDFSISPSSIVIQNDGKILAGGFGYSNIGNGHYLSRCTTNGTIDSSFVTGTNFDNPVNMISLQSDGKILVCGWFTHYNNVARHQLVRLNNTQTLSASENETTIALYPNPTKDLVYFDLKDKAQKIAVFDLSGKLLLEKQDGLGAVFQLDFSAYEKGIYFVEISTESGKYIKKIIKD